MTCVDREIPAGLGLNPIKYAPMTGVSQKAEHYPVYRMAMSIGLDDGRSGAIATYEADFVGVPSAGPGAAHAGLIGRDFLQYVRLVYDGPKGDFFLHFERKSKPAQSKSAPPRSSAHNKKAKKKDRRRRK